MFSIVLSVRNVLRLLLSLGGPSRRVTVIVGHAMCHDAKFVDVTIDLVLVMLRQGTHMLRDGSFDVCRDIVSARKPPAAVLPSERLFGSSR